MGQHDMVPVSFGRCLLAKTTDPSYSGSSHNINGFVAATVHHVDFQFGKFRTWLVTSEHKFTDIVYWTEQPRCTILSGNAVSLIVFGFMI